MSLQEDLVVMDVTESPIERPKRCQKKFFSGKLLGNTLKTQLIIHQKSTTIICIDHGKGRGQKCTQLGNWQPTYSILR
jgi:hypothetical protein